MFKNHPSTPVKNVGNNINPYTESTPERTPLTGLKKDQTPPNARARPAVLKMDSAYNFEKKGKNPAPGYVHRIKTSSSDNDEKTARRLNKDGVPIFESVEYLSVKGVECLEVTFDGEGRANWKNRFLGSAEAYNDEDGRGTQIFTVGVNNIFYSHGDKYEGSGQSKPHFHHSSFFSGREILCAGTWEANDKGIINKISNDSGHYKPKVEHLIYACRLLQHKMKMKDFSTLKVKYHQSDGKRPEELNALDFLSTHDKDNSSIDRRNYYRHNNKRQRLF